MMGKVEDLKERLSNHTNTLPYTFDKIKERTIARNLIAFRKHGRNLNDSRNPENFLAILKILLEANSNHIEHLIKPSAKRVN